MSSDSWKLIIIGAVGIAIGVILTFLPFFKRIELNYFDFLQLVSLSDSSADVAVVELDKKTTDMLGWPVGRDIYAAVVSIVSESGAKRIGFDLFLDSRAGGKDREDILEAELFLGKTVKETDTVLASYVTEVESETIIEDKSFFSETSRKNNYFCDIKSLSEERIKSARNSYLKKLVPGIMQHDVNLAHVHVIPSEIDGVYRSIIPCYPVFDGCIRDLGLYITKKTPDPEKCMETKFIPYFRKYEDVPSMSMADIIELSASEKGLEKIKELFSGRYVIFAATAKTLKDLGPTPGAEVEPLVNMHVNRIESLLSETEISMIDDYLTLFAGVVLALFFIFFLNGGRVLFATAVLGLPLNFGISWLVFRYFNCYIPVLHTGLPFFVGLISSAACRGWEYFIFNKVLSQAFDTYVSPEILNWLKETGGRVLNAESAERREITILFSDIAGYTSMSNELSAENIMKSLRYYLDEMMDVTSRNLGYVDKINGDGLMILFGAPKNFDRHEDYAVKCACEMQKSVAGMQDKWQEITGKELKIRIGVASGVVFVGNLGGEGHIEYSAIGRNVNLSARLESASEIGGILVSHDCYKKLSNKPDAWERFVSLKGYEKPLKVCQIIPAGSDIEKKIKKDKENSILISEDFYSELKEKPIGKWENIPDENGLKVRMFRVDLVKK